jgi:YD repeat-containing protein
VQYAYDPAGRLNAVSHAQGTTTLASITYGLDNTGNRTSQTTAGVTTNYSYDANNQLTGVTNPSTTATYAYDGDGYWVKQTVNGTSTTYAWDRLGLGGLGTVVADGSAENVFGPAGLQERVTNSTAQAQYAQGDGLGSVRRAWSQRCLPAIHSAPTSWRGWRVQATRHRSCSTVM